MDHYPLTVPIKLRSGGELRTLADVLRFVQSLSPGQQSALRWRLVAALVVDASETGRSEHIDHATDQFVRAAKSEKIL